MTRTSQHFTKVKEHRQSHGMLDSHQERFYDEMIAVDIPLSHPRYQQVRVSLEMLAALGTSHAHWLARHHIGEVMHRVDEFSKTHASIAPGTKKPPTPIGDLLRVHYPDFFERNVFHRLDALNVYATDIPNIMPLLAELRELSARYSAKLQSIDGVVGSIGSRNKVQKERHARYQMAWLQVLPGLTLILSKLQAAVSTAK